jgi:hypothetical protein
VYDLLQKQFTFIYIGKFFIIEPASANLVCSFSKKQIRICLTVQIQIHTNICAKEVYIKNENGKYYHENDKYLSPGYIEFYEIKLIKKYYYGRL